jgi:hypothetical protein
MSTERGTAAQREGESRTKTAEKSTERRDEYILWGDELRRGRLAQKWGDYHRKVGTNTDIGEH